MRLSTETNGVGIVRSGQKAESIEFGIGDNSTIIHMLRTNYSYKIQTPVQEVLSNARDAHREIGNTSTPVRVTLPTALESTLKIRDFGPGIDKNRLVNIVSRYGVSTKRSNDNQNGGYGIGFKSPFACCDSFTFVTYVAGTAYTYHAHVGENQNGIIECLGEEPTTEPNGTEVQIPVRPEDINKFVSAVFRATMFWDVKPELRGIMQEEIPAFYKAGVSSPVFSGTDWRIYADAELNSLVHGHAATSGYNQQNMNRDIVLAIDGMPYLVPRNLHHLENVRKLAGLFCVDYTLVLSLKTGECAVMYTRETVDDSPNNRERLNALCGKIYGEIQAHIKNYIDQAENFKDYVNRHLAINDMLQTNVESTFKTEKNEWRISSKNTLHSAAFNETCAISSYAFKHTRGGKTMLSRIENVRDLHFSMRSAGATTKETSRIFYNDTTDGPHKLRERLRYYMIQSGLQQLYIFEKRQGDNAERYQGVLDDLCAVAVSTLPEPPAVEREKKNRESTKGKIAMYFYDRPDRQDAINKITEYLSPDEIDKEKIFVYTEVVDGKPKIHQSQLIVLDSFLSERTNYAVCAIGARSINKVSKMKNFVPIESFIKDIKKLVPLSDEEREEIKASSWRGLFQFDEFKRHKDKIKDPEVTSLFDLDRTMNNTKVKNTKIPRSVLDTFYREELEAIQKEIAKENAKVERVLKKYPLIKSVTYYYNDDGIRGELIEYMNLKFQSEKG